MRLRAYFWDGFVPPTRLIAKYDYELLCVLHMIASYLSESYQQVHEVITYCDVVFVVFVFVVVVVVVVVLSSLFWEICTTSFSPNQAKAAVAELTSQLAKLNEVGAKPSSNERWKWGFP